MAKQPDARLVCDSGRRAEVREWLIERWAQLLEAELDAEMAETTDGPGRGTDRHDHVQSGGS